MHNQNEPKVIQAPLSVVLEVVACSLGGTTTLWLCYAGGGTRMTLWQTN